MRAVDRMDRAVSSAKGLIAAGGWLVLMTTEGELPTLRAAAGEEFEWSASVKLPRSEERLIAMGRRLAD